MLAFWSSRLRLARAYACAGFPPTSLDTAAVLQPASTLSVGLGYSYTYVVALSYNYLQWVAPTTYRSTHTFILGAASSSRTPRLAISLSAAAPVMVGLAWWILGALVLKLRLQLTWFAARMRRAALSNIGCCAQAPWSKG